MKRIKIAQVITRMEWGGAPDIVRIICENLSSLYEIKLITGCSHHLTSKTKNFLESFKENLITLPQLRREINPLRDFFALIKLYLIFKKEKFDIIHTHTAKAGFLGRIAAHWAHCSKIIYMPHGHVFYGYFSPLINRGVVLLEKFAARFTDKIIALTELEKNDFVSFKIKDSSNIEVVPSGMDLENFKNIDEETKAKKKRELDISADKRIVAMVSRLEAVKGPQYFIEAASAVVKELKKVRFLVVGEGSLRISLERKVWELGVVDEIKFLGWRDDILEIISILDILVQPSLNEAVGRVLLEAQFLGVPVVATNVGGIPEVIKDNLGGVLIPPKDSSSLAKAIISLLKDEEERLKISWKAKKWVEENFRAEEMVEKISSIYRSL